MMSERLYIDGQDVFKKYGVYVVHGGLNDLIAYPPLKEPTRIDWHEEDGIDVDLSAPTLNSREVTIKVATNRGAENMMSFIASLATGGYHRFLISSVERRYYLRLLDVSSVDVSSLQIVIIRLADDDPLQHYREVSASSRIVQNSNYTIDNKKLSEYGVRILTGTHNELLKIGAAKANLSRNISTKAGVLYDSVSYTHKDRDAKLFCLMRAETIDELWNNYDALLYDLVKKNERVLTVKPLGKSYKCYYKGCQVSEFFSTGKIWLQFSLTITITSEQDI